jgi:hypothetical protein
MTREKSIEKLEHRHWIDEFTFHFGTHFEIFSTFFPT